METANVFLNHLPVTLTHEATAKNGHTFINVSIPYRYPSYVLFEYLPDFEQDKDTESIISISVNKEQVLPACRMNGEIDNAFCNILLGQPERTRTVSIKTNETYKRIKMSNQDIYYLSKTTDFRCHNAFLNWVPVHLMHSVTAKNGNKFWNISIPYAQSANGFASISVSNGQVMTARKINGTKNDNFKNILLGAPDKVRQVSIKTADGYAKIELTNAQIFDAFEADRKAYKATNQAVAKA